MERFRLAVVGCGNVARMHLGGYALHPDRVFVAAACDPDPERQAWAAAEHGVPWLGAGVDELLGAAAFDVAVVLTPTTVREPVVRQLAAAGKHVFVEKPLADSYAEARSMVDACQRAGVRLSVDQNFRTHYGFGLARDAIREGRIGAPISVIHRDLMFRQDRGWRAQTPRHALSVMGVHWLDGFRFMLGQEATRVTASTRSSPAIDCAGETDAVVHIEFGAGATASYVQSFSSAVGQTETLVVGEEAALRLDYAGVQLFKAGGGKEPAETWPNACGAGGKPESAFRALDDLLTAIGTGREAGNSGQDNLKTIALLDACYRSAERGETAELALGDPL